MRHKTLVYRDYDNQWRRILVTVPRCLAVNQLSLMCVDGAALPECEMRASLLELNEFAFPFFSPLFFIIIFLFLPFLPLAKQTSISCCVLVPNTQIAIITKKRNKAREKNHANSDGNEIKCSARANRPPHTSATTIRQPNDRRGESERASERKKKIVTIRRCCKMFAYHFHG